jgi:hypothetical protein
MVARNSRNILTPLLKLTRYGGIINWHGRIKRWSSLDKIKWLSPSSIQLAPNPLTIILNVKFFIPADNPIELIQIFHL